MFGSNAVQAEIHPSWKANLGSSVQWQRVTTLGHVFVSCTDGLCSLDPTTGKVLWKNKRLKGLDQSRFKEIAQSPYFLVATAGGNPDTMLIDPKTDKKMFSSKQVGIDEIDTTIPLYRVGGILVAGKESGSRGTSAAMVDMVNGRTLWKMDGLDKIISVYEINKKEILLVSFFTIYRVQVPTGKVIWQAATSREAEQLNNWGAIGGLMKGLAENVAEGETFDIVFHMHPNKKVFYIGGQSEDNGRWSSGYYAYRVADGSRVWKNEVSFQGKLGKLIFKDRGFIAFPNDDGSSKINIYSYKDGKPGWGKKGRGIKITGGVQQVMDFKQAVLVISRKKDTSYVNLLDPNSGTLKWKKPIKTHGLIELAKKVPGGLLYVTDREINIIDINGGKTRLSKGVSTGRGLYQLASNAIYTWAPKEKAVYRLDLKSGRAGAVSKTKLKFKGGEKPVDFEIRADGYLVSSSQNMALFRKDGSLAYNSYFKAPTEPGLKRALLFAQGTRAALIGAVSAAGATAYTGAALATDENQVVERAIFTGAVYTYTQMAAAGTEVAVDSFKQAMARFKATQESRDFLFVLTWEKKTHYLAQVSKIDGKIKERIDLGRKKNVSYEVDDIASKIFYRVKPNEIACYKFAGPARMVTGKLSK